MAVCVINDEPVNPRKMVVDIGVLALEDVETEGIEIARFGSDDDRVRIS